MSDPQDPWWESEPRPARARGGEPGYGSASRGAPDSGPDSPGPVPARPGPPAVVGGPPGTTATALRPRPVRRPLGEGRDRPARPAPIIISRRDRRRVRIVERFTGKRVHNRVGFWRRLRSLILLILLAAVMAAALGAVLAAIIAGLTVVFRHASGS